MTKINVKKNNTSKRFGGTHRAEIARKELQEIFSNPEHPMYFSKSIDYARKFGITRHTVYNILKELKIPNRSERILKSIRTVCPRKYTIKQLSKKFKIKYQNLYKIIKEYDIEIKNDVPPIEKLKEYQRERKRKRLNGEPY